MNKSSKNCIAKSSFLIATLAINATLFCLLPVARADAYKISLVWDDNSSDESGFRIERADTGGSFAVVATVSTNTTGWVDNGVISGTTYMYRICAYNEAGDSPFSNVVSNASGASTIVVSTQPASPPSVLAGTNTSFTAVAYGSPVPTIQWQVSTNSGTTWANLSEVSPYSGTNASTLAITSVPVVFDRYQYRAVFTNGLNTAISNSGVLTMAPYAPQKVLVNKVVEPPK